MKITSVNLRNVYSFGDGGTPELKDFNFFNLMIGKNGTGKTNFFRAICELKPKLIRNRYQLWNDVIRSTFHSNNILEKGFGEGIELKIELEDDLIEFYNTFHICGDFKKYQGILLFFDANIIDIENQLKTLDKNEGHLLSFAMYYVFDNYLHFNKGEIIHKTIKLDGRSSIGRFVKITQWSSGYLSACKLIMQLIQSRNKIICIDEPEIHLEPRTIKRIMHIIFWLKLRGENSFHNLGFVENSLKDWCEVEGRSINFSKDSNKGVSQVFFASHSPIMVDIFLDFNKVCSIYEFKTDYEQSDILDENYKITQSQKTQVSCVQYIDSDHFKLLDNLGVKGSDILQSNGIIWVEGPSDVVYIKKWLDMFAQENNCMKFNQGYHYQFLLTNGAVLGHFYVDSDVENGRLINMSTISRNSYLVIDSDAIKIDDEIKDKSNFNEAKLRFESEVLRLKEKGHKTGMWFEKNNTDITTIEDYFKNKEFGKGSGSSKVVKARRLVDNWNDLLIEDFNSGLSTQIENLYNMIKSWQS